MKDEALSGRDKVMPDTGKTGTYQLFEELLIRKLREKLPADTDIGTEQVPRNRGKSLRGLTIHRSGEQVSPVIYLEECYQQYMDGRSIDDLTADILHVCSQCSSFSTDIADYYEKWDSIKNRIVRRIISRQGNEMLLKEVPYRPFLDLAVIFYCVFESREGFEAGVLIRNSHLKIWGAELQDLDQMADLNMPVLCPPALHTMQEMMGELLGVELPEDDSVIGLYVLTNRSKCYGAVYMTEQSVLKRIAERLHENYYILPSSLHECMIVPASINSDETAMQRMVEEINCTEVAPEEVLANSVYLYECGEESLKIVAAG